MKVVLAETSGFCGGVRKAVEKVCTVAAENPSSTVYVYGELAHNRTVMEHIFSLGAVVVHSPDEVPPGALVVIRAHGITDADRARLLAKDVVLFDATCPNVLRNQNAARKSTRPILLLGIAGHSEVQAIEGSIGGWYRVVGDVSDLEGLDSSSEYDIIVQTTFDSMRFDAIVAGLDELGIRYRVLTRICLASEIRRKAVLALADKGVDCILIAGDSRSANTKALLREAESTGLPSFLIENVDEVDSRFSCYSSVGLSAGSSTPDAVIKEIARRLEKL